MQTELIAVLRNIVGQTICSLQETTMYKEIGVTSTHQSRWSRANNNHLFTSERIWRAICLGVLYNSRMSHIKGVNPLDRRHRWYRVVSICNDDGVVYHPLCLFRDSRLYHDLPTSTDLANILDRKSVV